MSSAGGAGGPGSAARRGRSPVSLGEAADRILDGLASAGSSDGDGCGCGCGCALSREWPSAAARARAEITELARAYAAEQCALIIVPPAPAPHRRP
jgi:hypothetical protein